ncbi:DUF1048 domain-containing protein [Kineococcus aurantiacus]|uniref:DNA-binding ferritin-like protein (Dps family) n=1 Tax=Kineococcus aurantiacus TaxID=37633 RepID=A0A7Y9J1M3_9ACTN|nr:DUF1048 domain-containing protein [Kineococcus aurantiacus]NYD23302.1 DNA-binding ferritin-like protein (Dps family) [Kineococcus aurantiacus]
MSALIEKVVGDIGEKKRWQQYRARVRELPPGHRTAVEALERYLLRRGAITEGGVLVDLHEELVGTFEQAASRGTPIGEVVGADPVRFAEVLLGGYAAGEWIAGERQRLVAAFAAAQAQDGAAS